MKKTLLFFIIISSLSNSLIFSAQALVKLNPEAKTQTQFKERCSLLNLIIQEISQKINSGALTLKNARDIKKYLQEQSSLLAALQTKARSQEVEPNFKRLFAAHTIISNALYTLLKDNFATIPVSQSLGELLVAADTLAEELKSLEALVATNDLILKSAHAITQGIELTPLNKAYRDFYAWTQQHPYTTMAVKYGIPAGVALGSAIAIQRKYAPGTSIDQIVIKATSAVTNADLVEALKTNVTSARLQRLIEQVTAGYGVYKLSNEAYNKWLVPYQIPKRITRFTSDIHRNLMGSTLVVKSEQQKAEYVEEELTLDDPLFAHDPQIQALKDIVSYLANAEQYIKTGVRVPKAILITGPTGTGKSFAAKALSGSLKKLYKDQKKQCPFIPLAEMLKTTPNIAQVLRAVAAKHAPCLIYVDEIHLAGLQIGGDKSLLREFLLALDELDLNKNPDQQVCIVAATNRPELLDKALTRSGRFKQVAFQNTTFEKRKYLLAELCKKSAIDPTTINFDLIAHATNNCSSSDINKLFEAASFLAKQKREGITQEHFYSALNSTIRQLRPNDLSGKELEIVAHHQAGTALMHLLLNPATILESATTQSFPKIITEQYDVHVKFNKTETTEDHKPHYGAVFSYNQNEIINSNNPDEITKNCKLLVTGIEAQKVMLGAPSEYHKEDLKDAYTMLINLLAENVPLRDLSEKQQQQIKIDAAAALSKYRKEVQALLQSHKKELAALSKALQAKTFLTRAEIDQIITESKTA